MLNVPYHPYLGEDIYVILTVGLCHRIYDFFHCIFNDHLQPSNYGVSLYNTA